MTSPIDRAAEALIAYSGAMTNRTLQAQKVFESIDPDELAQALRTATDNGADCTEDYAAAVKGHLTGKDQT